MKALILAAGFGSRLRPITNSIPKPLCPFFGVKFLDLAHYRVKDCCTRIAINTHYLADLLAEHVKNQFGDQCFVSHESTIRGTGGSLYPLKDWLGDEDLVIYNADIISDVDIPSVIRCHQASNAVATMVMLPKLLPDKTPVHCRDSQVLSFGGVGHRDMDGMTFSGIHIISNALVRGISDTIPWSIIDTYRTALSQGEIINAHLHHGYWADLGTPQSLWSAHQEVLSDSNPQNLLSNIGVIQTRQQQGLAELHFDKKLKSAWAQGSNFTIAPKESFIDQSQVGDKSVYQSIIFDSDLVRLSEAIQNSLIISNLIVKY